MVINTSKEQTQDERGRVVREVEKSHDGELIRTTDFTYSGELTQPAKAVTRDAQGSIIFVTEFGYDEAGRAISVVSRDATGQLLKQVKRIHDEKGLAEERIIYGGKPNEVNVWRRAEIDGQGGVRESVEEIDPELSQINKPPGEPNEPSQSGRMN